MAIENRTLELGTKLVATFKKQKHRAEVVTSEEGRVRYRLADGREFKSPSAAGTAITGKACNGWAFWRVEGAEGDLDERRPEESAQPVVVLRRTANQRGVAEGQVRYHCSACQRSFVASEGDHPTACLAGHQAS